MVLFKLMEKDLKEIWCMGEFLQYIDKFLNDFSDLEHFKEQLRSFYINDRIVNFVRENLIRNETNQYYKNYKSRIDGDSCIESLPYCFLKKNTQFSNENQIVFRADSILSNLKSNYFDIKTSNDEYASRYVKKYTNDSFYDSLYRKRLHTATSFVFASCIKPNALSTTLGVPSNFNTTSIITKPNDSTYTSVKTHSNQIRSSRVSHVTHIDRGLLILRADHVCQFKTDVMAKKRKADRRKNRFFEKTTKVLYRSYGQKIKGHVERSAYNLKNAMKPSTRLLVKNQELRTSLQDKRQLKRSVARRHCHSEDKIEPYDIDANNIVSRQTAFVKLKSISSSINDHYGYYDNGSNPDDTDDDFIDDIRVEYRISMDKAFMLLNKEMTSRKCSLDKNN